MEQYSNSKLTIQFMSKSRYGDYTHTDYGILYDDTPIGTAIFKTKANERYISSDNILIVNFDKTAFDFVTNNRVYTKIKKSNAEESIDWITTYIKQLLDG